MCPDDTWPLRKGKQGCHMSEHGWDTWQNKVETCGHVRRRHVSEPRVDTSPLRKGTRGHHVSLHGWDMRPNKNVARGETGRCHVSWCGLDTWSNWKVLTYGHVSFGKLIASVHPQQNMLPAWHIMALTASHIACQRGRGHVDSYIWRYFCNASQKQKWFGDESFFVTRKNSSVRFMGHSSWWNKLDATSITN